MHYKSPYNITIYALLSNFWISGFTRFFAPPRPGPPRGFSSSPRPAPRIFILAPPRPAGKSSAPHIPGVNIQTQKT